MAWRIFYKEVLPFIAMISVECTNVGVNTLFKAATLKGMSYYVFIFYSYAFATLLLIPVPFIFRSTSLRQSLNLPFLLGIWVLVLIWFIAQIVRNKGIEYNSPTLASAMSNLLPPFTFALAIIFRLSSSNMRSSSTQAEVIGTIVSITGALVVVLYEGPVILATAFLKQIIPIQWPLPQGSAKSDWLIGGLLLATEYVIYSVWYLVQTQIMRICRVELLVTFAYTLCVSIISAPVCFIAEENRDAWRLRPDIALLAIIYSVRI
ncbi:WAT1-related protein At5g40240-like [Hevea brasiliensis]|uniref:WAT1-related protein At5g40240-like n=1 Tax=Hevea brasiliensis TaxID=3981 RepID=UPI0025DF2F45|nr:WAT1-related protein At5g40240-like [Hevea brasiliensis]